MDEHDHVNADATSYHSAIAACRRDGSRAAARAAMRLLQRMRRERLPTSLIGFTTAMNALSQAGYQLGALAVMQRMRATGLRPDDTAIHTALTACAAAGQYEQASLALVPSSQEEKASGSYCRIEQTLSCNMSCLSPSCAIEPPA